MSAQRNRNSHYRIDGAMDVLVPRRTSGYPPDNRLRADVWESARGTRHVHAARQPMLSASGF
ncbi:hypothetical protein [Tropicimonas sediminicola]|uniref:Uncharacterized protein n=1 Tax=Tropicimonas sediminicola TaxID=1031541 RepID=A0A239FWB1_9RHOB|nr:hypothetical protein [Tropicimonas sediminicola]SNS60503.1 hypothetical protein SAMN05421757_102840 [Tropicimonas sediminicola]